MLFKEECTQHAERERRGSQLIGLMLTFTGQTVLALIALHTYSHRHTHGVRRIAVIFYLVGICVSVAADSRQDAG